ncbi:nucleoid DNA-binding protein [Alkalispirochaeta americana]|uniref:Nucleoid DNA-binding protein n=1 Tax=Alkalispirochaeta americana TaxID=159291 RepID=A0A1N6NKQ7_9SPIO|nr:HU family DNA-binding protein [Alkalispirochaeta americana]SIP92709.1 nucleoid DNA-binding protein [Alkalispirochaeta americana]
MPHIDNPRKETLPGTVPEAMKPHLAAIAEETDLVPREAALQAVTQNWLEKVRLFREQTASLQMIQETRFCRDDPRGALLLTCSGSLIVLGPQDHQKKRSFEYASISLRKDVPDLARSEEAWLEEDLATGETALFGGTLITRSSEILSIATFREGLSCTDQKERLRQGGIFLTNSFLQANRTIAPCREQGPERFTLRSMVQYVAARNEMTQDKTREIILDYLTMVETGVLLGERVSLGPLGSARLHLRHPQKARMGRHPGTGEEMLIPAKPKRAVPRISFSSRLKHCALELPPERIDQLLHPEEGE